MDLTPPDDNELEISVVGRGYGESVVVHLGWGDWLVIDSCVEQNDPPTPYPALYLAQLGVPLHNVRWLMASHWHDDHVAGFAALTNLCRNADVFISEALGNQEFVSLTTAHDDELPGRVTSGLREMRLTLRTLIAMKKKPQLARADQRLFADNVNGVDREVWALSPSNAACLRSKQSFVDICLPAAVERRRVAPPAPNETSVALWIRVGDAVALLGADLENADANDRGWKAVLQSTGRPTDPASLIKLAHHGADNGDHPNIWTDLLERDAIAALTPYASGRRPRPDDADIVRIKSQSRAAYVAGSRPATRSKPSSPVSKVRARAFRNSQVSERELGHVRCRRASTRGEWIVDMSGASEQL